MATSVTNVIPNTHRYGITFARTRTGATIRYIATKQTVFFILNDAIANGLRGIAGEKFVRIAGSIGNDTAGIHAFAIVTAKGKPTTTEIEALQTGVRFANERNGNVVRNVVVGP